MDDRKSSDFYWFGFEAFGFCVRASHLNDQPYPQINIEELDPAKVVLLFSVNRFPFALRKKELQKLPHMRWGWLMRGSFFSWFGRRARLFLEAHKSMPIVE